jgi:hypothetical protein
MTSYMIMQKRSDGLFGLFNVTNKLAEAKKTKDYYHKQFKIPLSQIYIMRMVVY